MSVIAVAASVEVESELAFLNTTKHEAVVLKKRAKYDCESKVAPGRDHLWRSHFARPL